MDYTDPLGLAEGPNLYAYVHSNPLTHFDLYGLESFQLTTGLSMLFPINFCVRNIIWANDYMAGGSWGKEISQRELYSAYSGMAHGMVDFGVDTLHGFHRQFSEIGAWNLDLQLS